jgi:hypothetical protein
MIYSRNQEAIENEALHKAIEDEGMDPPCSNFPDAYYESYKEAGGPEIRRLAVELCQGCPVKKLCGDYAVRWEPEYGIWGGLLPIERRRERRRLIALGVPMPNLYVENAGRDYVHRVKEAPEAFELDDELEGDRFPG